MYIAAAMASILFAVSAVISVLNVIGVISTVKPWSLPISRIRSTMIPEIWLVLVSRNVNGMPLGVEPTRTACWATLVPASPSARRAAAKARARNELRMRDP